MTDVAVLGAGALGLAAARSLLAQGIRVTVLEREDGPGGLAAGLRIGGSSLEKFYHHIFRTDRRMISLIAELGLSDDLIWGRPPTALLRDGKIHRFDGPLEVLKFTPLSLAARIRLGLGVALLKAIPNPDRLANQTAADWLRRWMGDEAFTAVWQPQLVGKFGAEAEQIAMPWMWARIHDRTPALGYLRHGFQRIYDALADGVAADGGRITYGTAITGIAAQDGGVWVETEDGRQAFDAVLCTLPTRRFLQYARDLPPEYVERYTPTGDHFAAHCLVLELDRQLQPAYWVSVTDPGYPFLALVEHTNWLPTEDYGGRHLVYLGNYLPPDHPLMHASDQDVLDEFLPHLTRINPQFDRSWVTGHYVFKAPYAQPVVRVGYPDTLPPHRTPLPGVWLANMGHVYPHDRGQNYSVLLGEQVASDVLAELSAGRQPVAEPAAGVVGS